MGEDEWCPTVHFIIPCYKGKHYLRKCLNSIANQNYNHGLIKVGVVENGSREPGVEQIVSEFSNATYFFNEEKGRSQARNYLLEKTQQEVIAYIDVDVEVHEDWLKESIKCLRGKFVGAVGGAIKREGKGLFNRLRKKRGEFNTGGTHNTLVNPSGEVSLNTAAVLIKASVLKELGGFSTKYLRSEDTELTYRLQTANFVLASASKAYSTVEWSGGIIDYLTTRPFWSGFYIGVLRLQYSRKNLTNIFQIAKVNLVLFKKNYKDPLFFIFDSLIRNIFFCGVFLGYRSKSLVEKNLSIPIKKVVFFLNMVDSHEVEICQFNPQWKFCVNDSYIQLKSFKTSQLVEFRDYRREIIFDILKDGKFLISNEQEKIFIQDLLNSGLVIKIR